MTPLEWPVGRPRSTNRRDARFGARGGGMHMDDAIFDVEHELGMLRASGVVISYNRRTGDQSGDPGVAVYFELPKLGKHTLACDRWRRPADNLRAIALHIEALRGQERWGVGTIAAAFAGYKALPAVGQAPVWWRVLGFTSRPTADAAEAKYRELIRRHHPDLGGNSDQAATITAAWAQGKRELGATP